MPVFVARGPGVGRRGLEVGKSQMFGGFWILRLTPQDMGDHGRVIRNDRLKKCEALNAPANILVNRP